MDAIILTGADARQILKEDFDSDGFLSDDSHDRLNEGSEGVSWLSVVTDDELFLFCGWFGSTERYASSKDFALHKRILLEMDKRREAAR